MMCFTLSDLTISPILSPIFGGRKIFIGGTCFNKTAIISQQLVCKFGDVETYVHFINDRTAFFVSPRNLVDRKVKLQISLSRGQNYTQEINFYYGRFVALQVGTIPHYTTPHYTTLHYTTLHYTTPHHTTLHYTTLTCTIGHMHMFMN